MYNGVYPIYVKPYTPLIIRKPAEKVSGDPENTSGSKQPYDSKDNNTSTGQEHKSSINYNTDKININQILNDFKETIKAINPPEELCQEASQYLSLVKLQSKKEKPSSVIIKSNLRNAASILDGYISDTLKKPSEVVKNWIEALLLQKIDYKASAKIPEKTETSNLGVNPFKQVPAATYENVEEKVEAPQEQELQSIKQEKPGQPDSLDIIKLQKLYRSAAKLADSNNYDKAIETYHKALKLAKKTGDKVIQTKIYMDSAYIHDMKNNLPKALENYNNAAKSAKIAGDEKTQASAHYNMATIYDDVGKIDAALDHYHAALALDGSTDNIKGQTLTLNSIGNMHAVQKNYKSALDYYKLAFGLAKEQNDNKGKTVILSNVAGIFRDLGNDDKALKYYRDSIKIGSKSGNIEDCAKSYEQAGDIMSKNNQTQKAVNLYKKSMQAAQETGDRGWTARISEKISNIS